MRTQGTAITAEPSLPTGVDVGKSGLSGDGTAKARDIFMVIGAIAAIITIYDQVLSLSTVVRDLVFLALALVLLLALVDLVGAYGKMVAKLDELDQATSIRKHLIWVEKLRVLTGEFKEFLGMDSQHGLASGITELSQLSFPMQNPSWNASGAYEEWKRSRAVWSATSSLVETLCDGDARKWTKAYLRALNALVNEVDFSYAIAGKARELAIHRCEYEKIPFPRAVAESWGPIADMANHLGKELTALCKESTGNVRRLPELKNIYVASPTPSADGSLKK